MAEYFAHRGSKGNLGKKGKEHTAETRANLSEAMVGKEKPPITVPRLARR